jgi:hypothetical protein
MTRGHIRCGEAGEAGEATVVLFLSELDTRKHD